MWFKRMSWDLLGCKAGTSKVPKGFSSNELESMSDGAHERQAPKLEPCFSERGDSKSQTRVAFPPAWPCWIGLDSEGVYVLNLSHDLSCWQV